MTEAFIRLGHTVMGCGRTVDAIAELNARHGPHHDFAVVDVTDDSRVRTWARRCLAEHGAPDLLLSNAALINSNARLWEVPAGEFNAVIDVNIKGVANVLRYFVPAMVARGQGVIVNFSSGWGRGTDPEVAPYCASKWAMEGLTKALAQELPPGMAAIPLSPGIIDTAMLRSCFGDAAGAYPTAEEWAREAVPWLLRLAPRHTGQSLTVGDPL
jgi:NAD(P)-dependent dehydrogenase (short-subunit alcohol dehydrogenase family)